MQHNNTSKMLDVIRSYLSQQRKTKDYIPKSSYDDCILSLSEALKQVNLMLQSRSDGEINLSDMILREALKQGMIIHFDTNSEPKRYKNIS